MNGGLMSKILVASIVWLPLASFIYGGLNVTANASQQYLADNGYCQKGSRDIIKVARGEDGKLRRAGVRQACAK